ncbi:hypothetical protein AKO1_009438 [Acrasis kona]|uniref:Uncharacterized protein n=1 Tax=Acrasis kona TaxID=1008807 RepID=A0AAW2ZL74_9EUKA
MSFNELIAVGQVCQTWRHASCTNKIWTKKRSKYLENEEFDDEEENFMTEYDVEEFTDNDRDRFFTTINNHKLSKKVLPASSLLWRINVFGFILTFCSIVLYINYTWVVYPLWMDRTIKNTQDHYYFLWIPIWILMCPSIIAELIVLAGGINFVLKIREAYYSNWLIFHVLLSYNKMVFLIPLFSWLYFMMFGVFATNYYNIPFTLSMLPCLFMLIISTMCLVWCSRVLRRKHNTMKKIVVDGKDLFSCFLIIGYNIYFFMQTVALCVKFDFMMSISLLVTIIPTYIMTFFSTIAACVAVYILMRRPRDEKSLVAISKILVVTFLLVVPICVWAIVLSLRLEGFVTGSYILIFLPLYAPITIYLLTFTTISTNRLWAELNIEKLIEDT